MARRGSGFRTAMKVVKAVDRANKKAHRDQERRRKQHERERARTEREQLRAYKQMEREKAAQERASIAEEKAYRKALLQEAKQAYDGRCADRKALCEKYVNKSFR